jgi:signal transduction histidine kinase
MMMEDRTLGPDLAGYDHVVYRARHRMDGMRKLIADLLDLTRIESGQKKREVGPVELRAVGAACVEAASATGQARGIAVALAPGDPVTIEADPGEIELILNNLLSNAVKYNRDGGRVDLSIGADEDGVRLAVRDTGIGMSPAEVDRLFGEFVRIRNDRTRGIEGSGLGLSIVKKLADLYRGRVTVESEPGVGTCFTLTLPR